VLEKKKKEFGLNLKKKENTVYAHMGMEEKSLSHDHRNRKVNAPFIFTPEWNPNNYTHFLGPPFICSIPVS